MDDDYGIIEGFRSNIAVKLAMRNLKARTDKGLDIISPFVLLALALFTLWWIQMIVAVANVSVFVPVK